MIKKDFQYYKFCAYGFLKNMRFFDPFILLFFYDRGCSYLQIGFLFSIREISSTLLEVPSGVVADFTGRKNSMIFSFIAYILSFLIFSFAEQYWLFAIAMFLFAVGESFRSGTHKAMIVDYLKLHNMLHLKTEYYGSTRAWSQFGSAISSLIAGALVFFTGEYRIIFIASIFPYLLDLINLASYPKILNGTLTKKQSHTNTRTAFKSLISSPNLIHGLANSAVYDGIFKTIKDYLQPILKSFAIGLPFLLMVNQDQRSAFIVAIVYFILFLLSAFASKNAYKIKNLFTKSSKALNMTFIIGLIITIFSGFAYTINIELLSILFFILIYFMQNVRRPIATDYLTENIPSELTATGLSIETQAKTLTIAILAPTIGLLADIFGIGVSISIVAVVVLLIFPFIKVK